MSDKEYEAQYLLLTRVHPFIDTFDDWYTPEKRYPLDDLKLTPPMAKMWYCGDGSLNSTRGRATITCSNEADRIKDVADLIREQGFEVNTTAGGKVRVTPSSTPDFFEWMGEAPPDFEYKWP